MALHPSFPKPLRGLPNSVGYGQLIPATLHKHSKFTNNASAVTKEDKPQDKNRINSYTHLKRSRWDLEFRLKLRPLSPAKPLKGPWRKNYLQLATKTHVVLAVGSAPLSQHIEGAQSVIVP